MEGMKAIEIGGPTELFQLHSQVLYCYPLFSSIDNINNPNFHFPNNSQESEKKIFKTIYNLEGCEITKENISNIYDVIISSHTIEHMVNPIEFLFKSKELLRDNGYILTVLPNKPFFWDRVRETTSVEHLIEDHLKNTQEDDMTHLYDNINIDCPIKFQQGLVYWESLCKNNKFSRVMHHHCFEKENTIAIHEYSGYKTLFCEVSEIDPLQIIYFGEKA
jgi:SAM-dependent methyltransferase